MNTAKRKQQLLAQGAVYRAATTIARQEARACFRPEALARNALPGVALTAFSLLRAGKSTGAAVTALLPLLAGGLSAVRRSSLKPIVVGAVVAGGIVAAVAMMRRTKNSGQ